MIFYKKIKITKIFIYGILKVIVVIFLKKVKFTQKKKLQNFIFSHVKVSYDWIFLKKVKFYKRSKKKKKMLQNFSFMVI